RFRQREMRVGVGGAQSQGLVEFPNRFVDGSRRRERKTEIVMRLRKSRRQSDRQAEMRDRLSVTARTIQQRTEPHMGRRKIGGFLQSSLEKFGGAFGLGGILRER